MWYIKLILKLHSSSFLQKDDSSEILSKNKEFCIFLSLDFLIKKMT